VRDVTADALCNGDTNRAAAIYTGQTDKAEGGRRKDEVKADA
jgi:hypothetical protein